MGVAPCLARLKLPGLLGLLVSAGLPVFDGRTRQENAMPSLGIQELLIIFVILLVIFGGSKLPLLGRGMGEGIRNFKRGLRGDEASELEEKQG